MIEAIQISKSDKPALEVGTSAVFSPVRLIVSAEVRYWEDAEINGIHDTEEGDSIPLKEGPLWKPVIDLATGQIIGWPADKHARIHYKVCDQGEYWLEDAEGKRLKWKGSYVPDDLLCQGTDEDGGRNRGYGDYIIFNVATGGQIMEWNVPRLRSQDWENTQITQPTKKESL